MITRTLIISCVSLPFLYADDTACLHTVGNTGIVDSRHFPTTVGDTVINGRTDGDPRPCYIVGGGTNAVEMTYPNGLEINTNGTQIEFRNLEVNITNGLRVNDGNVGTGLVTFNASNVMKIKGDVHVENAAKLKFINHNTGSSSPRLRTGEAYFQIDAGSELQVEYKLGNTTGSEFGFGAIQGDGDIRLSNIGKSTDSALLYMQNGDGQDYTYNGDIYYSNQSLPSFTKRGAGTFIFNGDVKKEGGDSLGFTDGFGYIKLNGGNFQTTTEAFVYGTRVSLYGGNLIFEQAADASLSGAQFDGTSDIYKRGVSNITLGRIGSAFRGNLFIEEGMISLVSGANLSSVNYVVLSPGAQLNLSGNSVTRVSRLTGDGIVALGSSTIKGIVQIQPGMNGVGKLTFAGTGVTDLSGTLLTIEMDPTQAAGDVAGVTHDQLATGGTVRYGVQPVIKLEDVQQAGSPTAFLNGREFTVLTAAAGLSGLNVNNIIEDFSSFHAFIGADPETTIITDTEVKVKFGVKTVNQVATTVAQNPTAAGGAGSSKNKNNATTQYFKHTLGLSGHQAPTQNQLLNAPALQSLTTNNLTRAISNNNPEAYSSNLTLGLEGSDLMANMVRDQIGAGGHSDQMTGGDRSGALNRFWIDTAYVDGSVDGSAGETGNFDYKIAALAVGADIHKTALSTTGVYVGTTVNDMKEHDHITQTFDNNVVYAGVYNQYNLNDGFYIHSLASVFYGDHDSTRQNFDNYGGIGSSSSSSFSSVGMNIGTEIVKVHQLDEATFVVPSAGVLYTYLNQDDLQESGGGGAYDYHIQSADAQALVLSAGVDVKRVFAMEHGPLVATLRANYEFDAYANNNETHDIQANLAGLDSSSFVGQNRGPHGLLLGVGINTSIKQNATIGAGYMYSLRSAGHENSVGANFTYYW